MPLIHANAGEAAPEARDLQGEGPVVIMVHGFKYAPDHARECPHRLIYALAPAR